MKGSPANVTSTSTRPIPIGKKQRRSMNFSREDLLDDGDDESAEILEGDHLTSEGFFQIDDLCIDDDGDVLFELDDDISSEAQQEKTLERRYERKTSPSPSPSRFRGRPLASSFVPPHELLQRGNKGAFSKGVVDHFRRKPPSESPG